MKRTAPAMALMGMFVVTLAAGVVIGRLTGPRAPGGRTAPAAGASPLVEELQLSAEQAAQMKPIWEAARETAQACARDAEAIQREHEKRLAMLLTAEQRSQYARLSDEDHERIAALDARRKQAFALAVAKSRELLRPDQWEAYQDILKKQVGSVPGVDGATTQR